MEYGWEVEQTRQNQSTPKPHDTTSSRISPAPYQSHGHAPRTPEPMMSFPSQSSHPQPPNAPREGAPKFRIRRRTNGPLAAQLRQHFTSNDVPLPSIELSQAQLEPSSINERPTTPMDHSLLSPSLHESQSQYFAPPRTPAAQMNTNPGESEPWNWSLTPAIGAQIERPSSAASVLSDSSVSSVSSSETSPSFGDSCSTPESDFTDPFIFTEPGKRSGLASPVSFNPRQKANKRAKTSHRAKWTPEMDDHLWKTYLAYQTDPEVTPFKALPGVAPPLGVCHRVARAAKKTWKGPRQVLTSISENGNQTFQSIDVIMRETSAPPDVRMRSATPTDCRTQTIARSHSSTDTTRRPASSWPRSEASTRRRLRELCKTKPHLPAHYQRLMQTRSPSPFGSSSSSTIRRSSRINSSPPSKNRSDRSSFATDDLKLSLKAHTMSSMQPGNPLFQLSSELPAPSQPRQFKTWSSASASRSSHHKSQSLPFGPSPQAPSASPRSLQPLASPFQQQLEDPFVNHPISTPGRSSEQEHARPSSARSPQREEPWKIHAPRPMSGSMKRRAEYDLGEELFTSNLDTRRDFLQDLFRADVAASQESHKRIRSRGFSLGAMRHASATAQQQPSRQLVDLFASPPAGEQAPGASQDSSMRFGDTEPAARPPVPASVGNMVGLGNLAPPSSYRPPRLRSPFAPNAHQPTGFSNTFPRSMFPQGLDSISNLEHHRPHQMRYPTALQVHMFGSDGSNDEHQQPDSDQAGRDH